MISVSISAVTVFDFIRSLFVFFFIIDSMTFSDFESVNLTIRRYGSVYV